MCLEHLKIRAKRKDNGEWVKGFYFYKKGEGHYIIKNTDAFPFYIEIKPETICRLAYKDEKQEIWENDIVYDEVETGYKKKYKRYGVVKFDEDVCKYVIDSDKYYWYDYDGEIFLWKNLKVVGNIFDNKKLLEELHNER